MVGMCEGQFVGDYKKEVNFLERERELGRGACAIIPATPCTFIIMNLRGFAGVYSKGIVA